MDRVFERPSGPESSNTRSASLTSSHTKAKQSQGSWVAYPGAAGLTGGFDVCIAALFQATRLCKRHTLIHNRCKVCSRHIDCLSKLGVEHY
jgi:hypothetical protein